MTIDRRYIVMLIGLALAAYASCSPRPAYADETRGKLPAGTVIERRAEGKPATRTTLPAVRYLSDRGQRNRANACATSKAQLERLLGESLATGERLLRPEPTWRIAGRWAAVGVAIGAAFVGGAVLF